MNRNFSPSVVGTFALLIFAMCEAGIAQARQPACWPDATIPLKLYYERLPSAASSTMQYVAVYACKTPKGVINEVWAFNMKEVQDFIPSFLAGKFNEAEATAICAKKCETYRNDNSLVTAMRAISKPYLARSEVAKNGDSISRPVYRLKADGTRDPIAVPDARVAVAAGCNTNAAVKEGNISYNRVDNNPNVATADPADVLKDVVAVCSLITPLGVNN